MGMSRITVVVVGNHGCQREKKGADELAPCGNPTCVDCITREYVTKLKAGNSVEEATIHHWPGSGVRPDGAAGDVVDNLLSERRLGSF
jgi:hypothetical protein